jgi:hypothetical protein
MASLNRELDVYIILAFSIQTLKTKSNRKRKYIRLNNQKSWQITETLPGYLGRIPIDILGKVYYNEWQKKIEICTKRRLKT